MPVEPSISSLHDLTYSALGRELEAADVRAVHAKALWRALYREAAVRLEYDRPEFVPPLQRWLAANVGGGKRWSLDTPEVVTDLHSGDGHTRKFLLRLADGQTVETVIMGYPGRSTACVSTQVGCAMACSFCATGQGGFTRHLRPGEIAAQVLHCQRALRAEGQPDLRNLVLMGMGEPLQNLDAVLAALEIVTNRAGINIGPSRITLSTVGVVPGILRLARENHPYRLAVSLHSVREEERRTLIPATRRWSVAELLAACHTYCEQTGRRIFVEWTLISGVNDTPEEARELARALAGINAHVNLIPLNPISSFGGAGPGSATANAFKAVLQAAGFPSTLRQRRGLDIAAGCGQLKGKHFAVKEGVTPG